MFKTFFIVCLLSCIFSYLNMDPMKSSFFLVFALLSTMPLVSFMSHVWYSYFICLLFLSGIFVILVYFSSLSKVSLIKSPGALFVFLLSYLAFIPNFYLYKNYLMFSLVSVNNFYYDVYWVVFIWLILILILFMNFTSFFLNFSGALRKV